MACSLAAASIYSSCAAAQVNSFPEDLRGEPLSIAQFLTRAVARNLSGVPWG